MPRKSFHDMTDEELTAAAARSDQRSIRLSRISMALAIFAVVVASLNILYKLYN